LTQDLEPSSYPYEWRGGVRHSLDELIQTVRAAQRAGQAVVSTNGCFDVLHLGHTRFLEEVHRLGDTVIVAINSDESVRAIKGIDRPVFSEAERAEMLLALRSVAHVVVYDELLPTNVLLALRPTVHCKGGDYSSAGLPEARALHAANIDIRILPLYGGYSTSRIIARLEEQRMGTAPVRGRHHQSDWWDVTLQHLLDTSNIVRQAAYHSREELVHAAEVLCGVLDSGNRILICGNGGSAAAAQHFSSELIGHFRRPRPPQPAIALASDVSTLTALGNDFGFERVFSNQVLAVGMRGDALVAITTSGKSPNILAALSAAQAKGLTTIVLAGAANLPVSEHADISLTVPTEDTAHIQEVHLAYIHVLCELIDLHLTDNLSE
jgi:D-sedoheptulose 7-phosphate isomerase